MQESVSANNGHFALAWIWYYQRIYLSLITICSKSHKIYTLLYCCFLLLCAFLVHYDDVIMGAMASQLTSLTIVYSTVYSGADQSKHQSSASLAFVWRIHRGPVNSPHKCPVTWKMFLFDDVIMACEIIMKNVSKLTSTTPLQIHRSTGQGLFFWWTVPFIGTGIKRFMIKKKSNTVHMKRRSRYRTRTIDTFGVGYKG